MNLDDLEISNRARDCQTLPTHQSATESLKRTIEDLRYVPQTAARIGSPLFHSQVQTDKPSSPLGGNMW